MKKILILSTYIGLLSIFGCNTQPNNLNQHYGLDFKIPAEQIISQNILDKQYYQYYRYKTPVRISGIIKHECEQSGSWAFIENAQTLVLINFELPSPNIRLPLHQIGKTIIVEGYVTPDTSVFNGYHLIPYAFEFAK